MLWFITIGYQSLIHRNMAHRIKMKCDTEIREPLHSVRPTLDIPSDSLWKLTSSNLVQVNRLSSTSILMGFFPRRRQNLETYDCLLHNPYLLKGLGNVSLETISYGSSVLKLLNANYEMYELQNSNVMVSITGLINKVPVTFCLVWTKTGTFQHFSKNLTITSLMKNLSAVLELFHG